MEGLRGRKIFRCFFSGIEKKFSFQITRSKISWQFGSHRYLHQSKLGSPCILKTTQLGWSENYWILGIRKFISSGIRNSKIQYFPKSENSNFLKSKNSEIKFFRNWKFESRMTPTSTNELELSKTAKLFLNIFRSTSQVPIPFDMQALNSNWSQLNSQIHRFLKIKNSSKCTSYQVPHSSILSQNLSTTFN